MDNPLRRICLSNFFFKEGSFFSKSINITTLPAIQAIILLEAEAVGDQPQSDQITVIVEIEDSLSKIQPIPFICRELPQGLSPCGWELIEKTGITVGRPVEIVYELIIDKKLAEISSVANYKTRLRLNSQRREKITAVGIFNKISSCA